MKTHLIILAVAAIAFTPSCTTDQIAKATSTVQAGLKVAEQFHLLDKVPTDTRSKIDAGLAVASRLDLSKTDVASIIAQASKAVTDLKATGAIKAADADKITQALAAAEFLWTLKQTFASSASPHESEFPKLTEVAMPRERAVIPPQAYTILTRREASAIQRHTA